MAAAGILPNRLDQSCTDPWQIANPRSSSGPSMFRSGSGAFTSIRIKRRMTLGAVSNQRSGLGDRAIRRHHARRPQPSIGLGSQQPQPIGNALCGSPNLGVSQSCTMSAKAGPLGVLAKVGLSVSGGSLSQRFGDVPADEIDDLHRDMLQWMAEVEEGLQSEENGPPWMREPAAPVLGKTGRPHFALLNSGTIAAAVVDRMGKVRAASPSFTKGGGEALFGDGLLSRVTGARAKCLELVQIGSPPAEARSFIVAYAPAALAADWRLPPSLHESAHAVPDSVLLVSATIDDRVQPLRAACVVYGLTDLQARVAVETIRVGGIKKAHALPRHLRRLDERPLSLQNQPAPPHSGTIQSLQTESGY